MLRGVLGRTFIFISIISYISLVCIYMYIGFECREGEYIGSSEHPFTLGAVFDGDAGEVDLGCGGWFGGLGGSHCYSWFSVIGCSLGICIKYGCGCCC